MPGTADYTYKIVEMQQVHHCLRYRDVRYVVHTNPTSILFTTIILKLSKSVKFNSKICDIKMEFASDYCDKRCLYVNANLNIFFRDKKSFVIYQSKYVILSTWDGDVIKIRDFSDLLMDWWNGKHNEIGRFAMTRANVCLKCWSRMCLFPLCCRWIWNSPAKGNRPILSHK